MCHVILKVGLLALLAVAEHVGEFDRIIDLSQRYLNCHISSLTNGRFSYFFLSSLVFLDTQGLFFPASESTLFKKFPRGSREELFFR